MAYIRTTSETKTDNLLVEIDVNAYNEIEVDIKRSGLCVFDESLTSGLSGNGSSEGCTMNGGSNTGFRSVVKRSLTLEKEVSRLKWKEEYLTVCEDGSIYNAEDHRTASVPCMKNEDSKQFLNEINSRPKYFRENSESLLKSKEYKGMYLIANSNMSHTQETQEATCYVKTQGKNNITNNITNCQQGFPDKIYEDKRDASHALSSQPEEVKIMTYKGPKDISDDMHNLHPISYPQNQIKYVNEVDIKNTLKDVMAKSVLIEEIGKKLIQFLGSPFGQKLMKEYSNGEQKTDIFSASGNLLDPSFSVDMGRIKMIIDEICNALHKESSMKVDEESSELQQNPLERSKTNKFCSKDCLVTERSTPPRKNTEGQYNIKKESTGVVLNKSERKINHLNSKQSNRHHRNRYSTEYCKGKGNTEVSHKQGISVNFGVDNNRVYTSDPPAKMDCGKKSIISTVKETFTALLKNKLFENCFEKHTSPAQNKVEHQSVRLERKSHSSGAAQRGEYSQTGAKCKNGPTLIDRGSHLSSRKVIKISKQTAAATHTKTLKKSENLAPEYVISKQRKKSKGPYSVTHRKSDKTTKWRQNDFQKLLFELLETFCSKIKKKDLQRLSILLDILMKLQDQNHSPSVKTENCTEMVACYKVEQHRKDYSRASSMRQLHTVSSSKQNVHEASIEGEQFESCKTFFEKRNSNSVTKYKKHIQTNLVHNSESLIEKNLIKKQEHTKFISNRNHSRAVQSRFQSKTDRLSMFNNYSNKIQLQEDLEVPLNHIMNKKNDNSKDCAQFSENCSAETVVEGGNINTSKTRKLLPNCRMECQRQYDPENHCLFTKEGKNMNNFLNMIRPSDANQSYTHLNPSVVNWQGIDRKVKCPIYQRENTYECRDENAANIHEINKSVTIMGLSEAYDMYNNLTTSDVCLQRSDTKSRQICNQVHKIADVSSSLYEHATFRHDSSIVSINKINGVGVKINIPFSNEVIFPETTECYKKSLKTIGTLKFYLPFRIKSNNCMELIALQPENKDTRYAFEDEKDKSVTDNEEINLLKEECISERKCSPNSYFMASDECFTLHRALLQNVMMEHTHSNEQKITISQSTNHKESTGCEVESDGVLHETSSIFLIESPAGKQATHTNNCFSFQYVNKPLSPWKLEDQVGSFMIGAYTEKQYPVTSSFREEDYLDGLGDNTQDLPGTNLVSPYDIKTFDIKIIRGTRDHAHKIPTSRKSITKQLPTYFVFSAHDMKTNKEKMHRPTTRKTRKQDRNIHDPQSSTSNEPQIRQNYASYYQRPSICFEPTICSYDPVDTRPQSYNKNESIQNKRAKKDKVLHYHDFHTPLSPPKLKERRPIHSSEDRKTMNVVPTESISASEYPEKSLEKNSDTKELFSSSMELTDNTSKHKLSFESITNIPYQQSEDSLDNDNMKLNATSLEADLVQNIDHKEEERHDDLTENKFLMPFSPSKVEEKKQPPLSVRFKSDQRERVYPIETSSETSEEYLTNPQSSDYFPSRKSESKHNIFIPENEQSGNKNDELRLAGNHQYYTEEQHNEGKIKSFDRIKILCEIDANDMAKQADAQAATNVDNVPINLVSENYERDQYYTVPPEPQNTSENEQQGVAHKDSPLIVIKKDDRDNYIISNIDDSAGVNSKKQKSVPKIIKRMFSQKNDNEESKDVMSSLGASADMQSSSAPDHIDNIEEETKNMKGASFPEVEREEEARNTTPRQTGTEYDKWRLSQTRRLIKTHHALIKEAHEVGKTLDPGDSDGSDMESKSSRIKIGQSTWNACTPADFLLHFRRGFRDDQMTLNNKVCFVERLDLLGSDQEGNEETIDLMLTCHPLDFLVELGYSAEEAAIISQDEEIKCRLYAAIREARIWTNAITKPQAALLYLLAHKAKPKIMRYYLCLVESVVNRRIMNAVKLNELIDFLECLEDGEISLKDIFEDLAESDALEEKKKTEDLYTVFHIMAEEEAMNCGKYPLSAKQVFLIQTLVSKYHIALQDHLELLTRYIGRGLIKNTIQLEAALVYLPHVGRRSLNMQEFEQYCGIKSKRKIRTRSST